MTASAGPAADTIFVGGTILTMNPARPAAEAIAVRDGRITAVGDRDAVLAGRGSSTEIVDLGGGTLLPGFIEPHGHPIGAAAYLGLYDNIQPFTAPDAAAVDAAVRAAVARAAPDAYVALFGLDPVLQAGVSVPTLAQLDAWSPSNPLIILANSGHAAYGNTAALARAGITGETPNPTGGEIVRDAAGAPTGEFREESATGLLMRPLMATTTPALLVEEVRAYLDALVAVGITAVSDHAYNPRMAPLYRAVLSPEHGPVRVRAYEVGGSGAPLSQPPMSGDDLFRLIGVKYWADGSPWQGNIAVSVPYLNTPVTLEKMGLPRGWRGGMNYTKEEIAAHVALYFPQGYQFAIHAHGDLALDAVLDVYDAQLQATPRPDHRLRLEHCGCITDAQLARAARLGVTVSLFMAHVYYWGDVLHDSLFPPAIADRWAAAGSALRAGARFTFHNDGFVSPTNPLRNIQTAVTRRTNSGRLLGPEQAITVEQALRAHTIDAAYQLFMDDLAGSLEPGKAADLVHLAADPLTTPADQIAQIEVKATYLNGKLVARLAASPLVSAPPSP